MQNKKFEIKEINSKTHPYIVLSTHHINPIQCMDELEKELSKKGYSGRILLDLLLSNGYNEDRFFEIYFDGNKLNLDTLANLTNVSEEVRLFSVDYYSQHFDMIKNSVLTKPQRYLIRKKRIY
jgi:hypothetical protein